MKPGGALAVLALTTACGSSAATAPPPVAPARSEPGDQLAGATVYDAAGTATACQPPRSDCTGAPTDRHLAEQCQLGGYQIRQCGCAQLCSGNVAKANLHYDEVGNAKPCAPVQNDCTPPDTSAAFQDACTDAHHRLEVCGCEWLCSGAPKR